MKLAIQRDGDIIELHAHVPHGPDAARIASMVLRSDNVLFNYSPDGEYWTESETDEALVFRYRVQGLFACSGASSWAHRLPRDIAFILEFDKRSRAGDKREIQRDKLAPYPVEYFYDSKPVADADALDTAMAEPDSVHAIGTFALSGPVMRVSDPCYEKTSDSAGTVDALPGNWHAETVVGDTDWFRRVKALRIRHESMAAEVFDNQAAFSKVMTAGVDSGQCGFFDDAVYPEGDPTIAEASQTVDNEAGLVRRDIEILDLDEVQGPVTVVEAVSRVIEVAEVVAVSAGTQNNEPLRVPLEVDDNDESESDFYADCCRLTADDQLPGGGVLTAGAGVVSRSGFGDGGYAVKVLTNADGQVVAAVLEYLVDGEDEDND